MRARWTLCASRHDTPKRKHYHLLNILNILTENGESEFIHDKTSNQSKMKNFVFEGIKGKHSSKSQCHFFLVTWSSPFHSSSQKPGVLVTPPGCTPVTVPTSWAKWQKGRERRKTSGLAPSYWDHRYTYQRGRLSTLRVLVLVNSHCSLCSSCHEIA